MFLTAIIYLKKAKQSKSQILNRYGKSAAVFLSSVAILGAFCIDILFEFLTQSFDFQIFWHILKKFVKKNSINIQKYMNGFFQSQTFLVKTKRFVHLKAKGEKQWDIMKVKNRHLYTMI